MSTKLTIDRGEHLTGEVLKQLRFDSALHTHDVECCLGIACRKLCDIDEGYLEGTAYPSELGVEVCDTMRWAIDKVVSREDCDKVAAQGVRRVMDLITTNQSPVAENVVAFVNDEFALTAAQRESLLVYLFKTYGDIELTFEGDAEQAISRAISSQDYEDDEPHHHRPSPRPGGNYAE